MKNCMSARNFFKTIQGLFCVDRKRTTVVYDKIMFFLGVALFSAFIVVIPLGAAALQPGEKAPFFQVESGDGRVLTSDAIRGKCAVIFYETKDTTNENRRVKDSLNLFYYQQNERTKRSILRIPIIDCSDVSWLFKGVWKRNLVEWSDRERLIIYGDWDGEMKADYGMKDGASNLLLIDRNGIIRYFHAGEVESGDIGRIRLLLIEMLN